MPGETSIVNQKRTRRAGALGAALALTLLVGACAGTAGRDTEVLGRTEERSTTSAPSTTVTTTATTATTATSRPAPVPCTNPLVGYTVTPPPGWYPSGDQPAVAACEVFDRRPVGTIGAGGVSNLPIVIRSLGPRHELLNRAATPRTSEQDVLDDTRLDGPAALAGRPAARFEFSAPSGTRTYTYLVDTGPTVLALQYAAAAGQSRPLYATGKQALDQLAASLRIGTPGCLDDTDPRCGAFYSVGDPPDAPIRLALPAQPVEGRAGEPVTFEVTADDADAGELTVTASDGCVEIGDAATVIRTDLRSLVRSAPASAGERFGPWHAPPDAPGHATLTVTWTFAEPGDHTLYLTVRSHNRAFAPTRDPYASLLECVPVVVRTS